MKFRIPLLLILSALCTIDCHMDKPTNTERRLGDYVQISLSSTNLDSSLNFYQQLGFDIIDVYQQESIPWALLSDGLNIFMISQNNFPSPTLTYYGSAGKKRIKIFKDDGVKFEAIFENPRGRTTAILSTPNLLNITIIDFKSNRLPKPSGNIKAPIGKFDEISIPLADLSESLTYWKKLGFAINEQLNEPYPCARIGDGLIQIGLHETTDFEKIAFTFSSDNLVEVSDYLKQNNSSGYQERSNNQGIIQSIFLESPAGQIIRIIQNNY